MSALSGVLAQTPAQKALLCAFLLVSAVNLSSNLLNDLRPAAGPTAFTCECTAKQGATGVTDAEKCAAEKKAAQARDAAEKPFETPAFISKVLLMPLLAALYFLRTRGAASDIPRLALMLALFACWLGDIFLGLKTKDPSLHFMLGMGAFGVAHLFYIRGFLKAVDLKRLDKTVLAYGLPFIVYAFMMYSVLYHDMVDPGEESMRLPLGLYMVVLISNGLSSFLRFHQQRSLSAASILAGVVLFVQSDSFIAVARFVDQELPLEDFSVMATYILGQYLIIRGCVLRTKELAAPQEPRATLLAAA
ncbi:hypothetical protein BO221_43165 [Archangium sp. Cb G35]|uniref:lysoplasmalogenase n=1 Tax=Archangium sp. Cb G35 TaxID=1920190 RepID=UPI000937FDF4|nr:lysoplasmalogenase [Archangium sp. Cb G35]OJT17804.1 hypothetical protein BO221_43165 [Archangium sp. Cb G35]